MRREDLEFLRETIVKSKYFLSKFPVTPNSIEEFFSNKEDVSLDFKKRIYLIFSKIFEAILLCLESAYIFFNSWKEYNPVMLIISDIPKHMTEKYRSLEEYDKLIPGDIPFWLR